MNIPTEAEVEAWLDGRPDSVRELVRRVPPTTCYRLKSTGTRGHYVIHSYAENGTVTLRHGADSHLPGVAVFGITPDDVVPCGCLQWEPPSDEQVRATKRRLDGEHGRLPHCPDPSCAIHRNKRPGGRRRRGRSN